MPDDAKERDPNVRSSKYIIIESRMACPHCSAITAVFAFALPPGHESIYVDDDTPDEEIGTWEKVDLAAILSYVSNLPDAVTNHVRGLTSGFVRERDDSQGCWTNHCEHCGERLDDQELHDGMDGPFGPEPREGLESVRLHEVREPFQASVGGEAYHLVPLDS